MQPKQQTGAGRKAGVGVCCWAFAVFALASNITNIWSILQMSKVQSGKTKSSKCLNLISLIFNRRTGEAEASLESGHGIGRRRTEEGQK